MPDQAEKLRNLIKKDRNINVNSFATNEKEKKSKVISITSGKGGVGKTNFTINLAISLKRLGYEVVVFDADIGLANIDIVSGTITKYTISNLLKDGLDIFEVIHEGPEGIKILSGGTGINELTLIDDKSINKIIDELGKLERFSDFILIDTGAGIHNSVTDFIMSSDEVIVITTPDPTSITDSYTLIKTLVLKGYKRQLNVVINMVDNRANAYEIFDKLNRVTDKFLNIELNFLGFLDRNNIVSNAVRKQVPFVISNPYHQISKKINIIALNTAKGINVLPDHQPKSFVEKLKYFLLKKGD